MSLAEEIRKIQNSESSNKVQEVAVLFEQYREYLGLSGEWKNLFLSFETVVCDNINTPSNSNIVPLSLKVPDRANLFAVIFGMNVIEGKNVFYLSWSAPLGVEDPPDVEARVVAILKAAYAKGTTIDVLNLLQDMLPNKDLQIYFGTYQDACQSIPGKKVFQIKEETPETKGLYLYCN